MPEATETQPIVLSNKAYDELVEALAQPAEAVPELVDLFSRRRVAPTADGTR